jgi:hypothetical protein
MGFNTFARRVRDPCVPLNIRRSALRACIERYGWLTGLSFSKTWDSLAKRYQIDDRPTGIALYQALSEIEASRNSYLADLNQFARIRSQEKACDRRQPTHQQLEALEIRRSECLI